MSKWFNPRVSRYPVIVSSDDPAWYREPVELALFCVLAPVVGWWVTRQMIGYVRGWFGAGRRFARRSAGITVGMGLHDVQQIMRGYQTIGSDVCQPFDPSRGEGQLTYTTGPGRWGPSLKLWFENGKVAECQIIGFHDPA